MKRPIQIGRIFYAIALLAYGTEQFAYGNFRHVLFPVWQFAIPFLPFWAYLFGAGLILAALAIIFQKKPREVSLVLASVFLVLFCLAHVPYELISEPNHTYHLGLWTDPLKELAYAGGAFVMAGTFHPDNRHGKKQFIFPLLERLIPVGSILFCITMTSFGIMHFMYLDSVTKMVPAWIPDPLFWTCFAAVALIGSGTCIILNIRRKFIAILLSLMIFLWLLLLHIPSAARHHAPGRSNEISSAFDALLFCGVALLIAFGVRYQTGDDII
jgi:uncharacterized membrane protein YphA (DoxX/SURF4 family)